jgi:competence protein ComEC
MIATHKGEITIVVLLLPFMAGIGLGLNYPGTSACFNYPFSCIKPVIYCVNFGYAKLGIYKKSWLGGLLIAPILLLCRLAGDRAALPVKQYRPFF